MVENFLSGRVFEYARSYVCSMCNVLRTKILSEYDTVNLS